MRARRNNIGCWAVMLLLAAAPLLAAPHAQHLLPPSPTDCRALEAKLDPALMPAGASHRHIDPRQTFQLVGPHGVELSVAPVDFNVPNPDAGVQRHVCGIYVVPVSAPAYFLDGTPDGDLPIQCWKVVSVRLVRKPNALPDIVFVGDASLTTHSWRQDYVLSRTADGPYRLSADYKDAPGQ